MAAQSAIGAVDIGGTKIAVATVDAAGRLLAQEESPTQPREGFDAAMYRVERMLERACENSRSELCGIGIGCTGPVDPATGDIGEVDFLPGWRGRNPVMHLATRFGVSVAMENDADAIALGEFAWGAGRSHQSIIAISVGTGIGAGIILDGKLYRGVGGAHPEVGHHVIDINGPPCFCGSNGCWEVLARGPAMVERLLRHAPADYPHRAALSADFICDLARRGDGVAVAEVAREARYLGIGIANLVTLYAPEVIVLAGNVMQSADLWMPTILDIVRRHCGLVPAERVEIRSSPLKGDAPLVGAAMVWRQRCPEVERVP